MPFRSQAQSRLMHAVARDPAIAASTGVPQEVAKKFVAEGHGSKVRRLPQHVPGSEAAEEKGEPKRGHAAEERREHGSPFKLPRKRR
jgi:hypothetical protein